MRRLFNLPYFASFAQQLISILTIGSNVTLVLL